eukprot:gene496-269_t
MGLFAVPPNMFPMQTLNEHYRPSDSIFVLSFSTKKVALLTSRFYLLTSLLLICLLHGVGCDNRHDTALQKQSIIAICNLQIHSEKSFDWICGTLNHIL